ncbi:hypothetical protein [Streptomyces sp. KL118A]|uniref:hypothetical protein n=1 Tax=Streptomyces sp. KL118A TaxID=3045153 RepID=UPI00278C37E8|nr:hypothetical protein [Streptomyces sp. KL118A]
MSERKRDEQGGFERHGRNEDVNHGPVGESESESEPESAPESAPEVEPEAGSGAADAGAESGSGSLDRLRAVVGTGSGSGGTRGDGSGPGSGGELGSEGDLGSDELALRRLMRQAVQEIEPGDRALDHLRKAVPARRARKRQAVVGLAAAALFIGTAVPALVHVTNSNGDSDDRTSIAGNSQDAQGGSSQGKDPEGGEKDSGAKPDKSKGKDKKDKKDKKGDKEKGGTGGGGTGSPDPSTSEAASSPVCDAAQLGATGSANPADANGAVYGSFRVSNISDSSCTVEAAGAVGAVAQGAADPAKVGVIDHTAGDAATGLPDPSQEASPLVLQPGAAYEVRFAWLPSDKCPSDGGEPTPNPTPSEGGTGTPEGGTPDGMDAQLERSDGGVADGSVVVSLTAEAGAPSAGATITNACAGTVYRTGVLPAS